MTSTTAAPQRRRPVRAVSTTLAAALAALAIAGAATPASAAVAAPALSAWGDTTNGLTAVPSSLDGRTVTDVAAGVSHALALTSDGKLTAWGDDNGGETAVPADLGTKTVTDVTAGLRHEVALDSTGHVTAWGSNTFGQTNVPAALADETVVSVSAGAYHTIALTSTGKVYGWGFDGFDEATVPASLDGKTVVAIAAGGYHNLALLSTGEVVGWGNDADGQTDVPASLAGQKVTAIAAGEYHSLALTSDGRVTGWGNSASGQASLPTAEQGKISAIAASGAHSVAIASNGRTIAFGSNGSGESTVPAAVRNSHISLVAASSLDSFAFGRANQAPVVADQQLGTDYATPFDITLDASDADDTDLTYTVTRPAHGTLSGEAPSLTYTPASGYSGADTFTYSVSDGRATSTATVNITVGPKPGAAPVAKDVAVTTTSGTAVKVTLSASDPDSTTLSYKVSAPSTGTLSGTAPNLTYTPPAGYTGTVKFTYSASDGVYSASATVTVTVNASAPAVVTPKEEFVSSVANPCPATSITSGKVAATKGNELLVAFISANGPSTNTQSVTSVTGGGLTWIRAARSNIATTQGYGTSEVWQAMAKSPTAQFQVKATFATSGSSSQMSVVGFTNATYVTGSSSAAGKGSVPSVKYVPAAGSLVYGVGRVSGSLYASYPSAGTKLVAAGGGLSPKATYWVQKTTAPATGGKTVTVGGTAATASPWAVTAVEVKSSI